MAEDTPELGSLFDFSQDLSTAEAPPPLPARKYQATVTSAVPKMSQKGNTYAEIGFTVDPSQFPPDFAAIQKDAVVLYHRRLVLEDSVRGRYQARKFCEALRVPTSKRLDLNDFVGKIAVIEVTKSSYNGEDRADIKTVEAA